MVTPAPGPVELTEAFIDTATSLGSLLEQLPDDAWSLPTGCPGRSVQDTVSHVIGLELDLDGRPDPEVELPALQHLSDGNRMMEHSVQARRGSSPAALRAEYAAVMGARTSSLRALAADPERDADARHRGPFGWELKLPQLLALRLFDLYAHEQDVRRATVRPGHLDCLAMRTSLSRCLVGVVRTLAAEVPAAAGKVVAVTAVDPPLTFVLDLTGPKPLAVEGAADAPAASLSTTASTLLALLCGRSDADPSLVSVAGETVLAGEVLSRLAVTP